MPHPIRFAPDRQLRHRQTRGRLNCHNASDGTPNHNGDEFWRDLIDRALSDVSHIMEELDRPPVVEDSRE